MRTRSALDAWRERWQRRGELLIVAAFSSALALGATGEWVPLLIAVGTLIVGVYVVCAAEADWWLPGRKKAQERAELELAAVLLERNPGDATARELARLNSLLERLLRR